MLAEVFQSEIRKRTFHSREHNHDIRIRFVGHLGWAHDKNISRYGHVCQEFILPPLNFNHAAINDDFSASYKTRIITCKKQNRLRKLDRLAHSLHWNDRV